MGEESLFVVANIVTNEESIDTVLQNLATL